MTTQTSLTDRYVDATLRSVPSDKRPDIERELRVSIADAIDDRVGAGDDRAAAEVAVLTALGDPARLAAGYADRPLYLIGPALFLDYVRLLRALTVTVLPITGLAVVTVQVLRGGSLIGSIGAVVSAVVLAGVHVAFWTTLAFAVLERVPDVKGPLGGPWTPDRLPEPRRRGSSQGELVAETVWAALVVNLLLFAPLLSTERDEAGYPINTLHPWLWESGVIFVLIGLILANVVALYVAHYARLSIPLEFAITLVRLGPAALLIWLAAAARVVNPAFVDAAGWSPEVARWIHIGLIIAATLAVLGLLGDAAGRVRTRR